MSFWVRVMSKQPILQLHQVSKQFDDRRSGGAHRASAPAVNQVSLDLAGGEILGLLGPSGCGKTTLLRLIGGFEQVRSGEIRLGGEVVADGSRLVPPEQRDIGMVFQDYALFPHLTVAKNVAFGLQRQKFSPTQVTELVKGAIGLVGLAGLAERYPHELSGGQQQRVALARAIAPQPTMILLDEPLSNLDVQVRLYLRQEIRNILKTAGTAAVFVTHDQEEALSICDRVAVMNQGELVQVGRPEDLYQNPQSKFVAEFVTQANFLSARLVDGFWVTEVGQFPTKESTSDRAEIMVRQEDVQLVADEGSRCVVRDRQFLGREYRYWMVTPEGRSIYARSALAQDISAGDYVRLDVSNHAIQVFPAELT
jgi:iron(III) transport system ATP-binding protein